MHVSQDDIKHLRDDDIRRLVLTLTEGTDTADGSRPDFQRLLAAALVRALRQRRRTFLLAEDDFINSGKAGAIVEEGDDPVADALDELRRAAYRADDGNAV